jgi:hypothetical protein
MKLIDVLLNVDKSKENKEDLNPKHFTQLFLETFIFVVNPIEFNKYIHGYWLRK